MNNYIDKNTIKEKVSIRDILNHYNIQVNRMNFCVCPFHANGNEKTASMKIKDDSNTFHCYSCHEKGDIITFVKKMENCSFVRALEMIDYKFGLNLGNNILSDADIKKINQEKNIQQKKQLKLANQKTYKNMINKEIMARIRSYQLILDVTSPPKKCNLYEWMDELGEVNLHAEKQLQWLEWLYDIINGLQPNRELYFDEIYGDNPLEILRMLYKGKIDLLFLN